MTYVTAEIEIKTKNAVWYVDVVAEGYVVTGGSNSYGSDEPEWCEVEDFKVTRENGKPLPPYVAKAVAQHSDWLQDLILEAA